jgi:hypothetical protein
MNRLLLAALFVLVLAAPSSRAERVPLEPHELAREATHILQGKVAAVYSREIETEQYGKGTLETHFVVALQVDGVEKGKGVEAGDLVYVRCWQIKRHGAAGVLPGPSGHRPIPGEGEVVKAYAIRGGDRGFDAVYLNGFQTVDAAE